MAEPLIPGGPTTTPASDPAPAPETVSPGALDPAMNPNRAPAATGGLMPGSDIQATQPGPTIPAPEPEGSPVPQNIVPAPIVQAPTPAPNPFGMTALDDPGQTTGFIGAAAQQDISPEAAAKALKLSMQTGIPADAIKADPDGFEKQMQAQNFSPEHFVQTNPDLAAWVAQNSQHFPLIKDDFGNIKQTQDHVNEYGMMSSAYDALSAGLAQTYAQVARIPGLAYDVAALPQNIVANLTGWDSLRTRASTLPFSNKVAAYYEDQSKIFTDRNSDLNGSIIDEAMNGSPTRAGRIAFAKMVQMAPGLAAMMAGGAASHAASLAVMAAGAGAEAANRPENLAADPVMSTLDSLAQGGVMAASGEVGTFGVLNKWHDVLAQDLGKAGAKAVVAGFAKALGYAFTTDATSNAAMSAANDLTDYATGVNPDALNGITQRTIESGLVGGLVGAANVSGMSVLSHSMGLHDVYQARRQAELQKDTYIALGSTMEASKVRERLPPKYQEMVSALTKDGPIDSVHVDPSAMETFYQTKGPDDLPKILSDLNVQKEFDQAKETGGLLKVPMADWAEHVVGTDAHAALADDVTFDPEKSTVNESKAAIDYHEANNERFQDVGQDSEDATKSVQQQVKEKLVATGMDPKTAEKNASLYNFFNVVGQSEGISGEELFNRYNVNISRELPETLKAKNIDEFDPILNRLRNGEIPTEQQAYGQSLIPFLKSKGGINHEGLGADVRDLGHKGLSRPEKGMDFDKAVEAAHESGYIKEPDGRLLLNAIEKEHNGQKVHSPENMTSRAEEREMLLDLQEHLNGNGIDLSKMDNESIKNSLDTNSKAEPKGMFDFLQGDTSKPLGGIQFGPDGVNIGLLKNANLSTFLHETGHLFTKVLGDLANHPNASDRTKEIYQALLDFSGAKTHEGLNVDAHEKIAEGFEKYLLEGKAPTSKLREAFSAFKAWIIHAYRSLSIHPDVQLSSEVRGAFDRMLATDDEIKQARDLVGLNPLIKDVFGLMNPEDAKKYTDLTRKASEAADEALTAKNLQAFEKERSRMYKIERDSVERDVRNEVNENPDYKTLDQIKTGKLPNGDEVNLKLDRKVVVKDFGKEIAAELSKQGVFGKDGLDYHSVSDLVGMNSGHELVVMLANLHPKEEVIQQAVDQEMTARHAHEDPSLTGAGMEKAAMDAIHNTPEAERMAFELKWMMENHLSKYKDLMAKVGKRVLTAKSFRDHAQAMTSEMTVSELKPYIHQRNEAKYANEAMEHALKGNWDKAFLAKSQELLNHELYKSVSAAQEVVSDAVDKFKDFNQKDDHLLKTRDLDLINAGRSILTKFGIGAPDMSSEAKGYADAQERYGKKVKDADAYIEKLKSYGDPDQYNQVKNLIDSMTGNAKKYSDLTYDEFSGLKDNVNAMWDLSKENRQNTIAGIKMDRAEIIQRLSDRIDFIDQDKKVSAPYYSAKKKGMDGFKTFLMGAKAQLTRIEHWCDAMDGGDKEGAFRQLIWNPIKEGAENFVSARDASKKVIDKLVQEHLKNVSTEAIRADELAPGAMFGSKADLLGALLHRGNDSNMRKLLLGYGWGSVDEHGNLDRSKWDSFEARMIGEGVLEKSDFDFVQGVWDHNETLKPDAQKAHKARYGSYFAEITNTPFDTAFGKYKGGYMPAVVDGNVSLDPKNRAAKAQLEGDSQSSLFPRSLNGFTKARVETYSAPLSINLQMINSHIEQVLKFTHIAPAVHDVSRVILDKGFSRKLTDHDSAILHDALVPWLDRSVQQTVSSPSKSKTADGIFKYIRNNSGMQTMFMNVKNILQQPHGIPLAMTKVAPLDMISAGRDFLFSPKETAAMISDKSTFMRNKLSENGLEIEKTLGDIVNPSKLQKLHDFSRAHTYFFQTAAQNAVNIMVWKGSYERSIADGYDEKTAVNAADGAVSQTQHNFAPESISNVEHGTPFARLFTMFYSYFNMKANLMGSEFSKIGQEQGLAKKFGRGIYVAAATSMIPAALMTTLGKALDGKPWCENGEQDCWQDFLGKAGMTMGQDAISMVPGGQFLNSAVDKLSGKKPMDDKVSLSPALEGLNTIAGLPAEIYLASKTGSDKLKAHAIKDSLTAIGLITGTPVGALGKPIGYLNDVSSGRANPKGPVDYTRGLLTGQRGN